MEQLGSASLALRGSFGARLRAWRHRACLSQEQLAARAGLSERTVRDLEAGRVRSPRPETVRLLADALQLSEPERASWLEAARAVNPRQAEPAGLWAGEPACLPGDAPAPLPQGACGSGSRGTPRHRRSFTAEFKAELVAHDGGPIETAAPARAGQAEPGAGTRDDDGLTGAERRELAQLRRENLRLRDAVEFLMRATAIVAAVTR
jgi:transcriptional regulator with XRE-family HTH domain